MTDMIEPAHAMAEGDAIDDGSTEQPAVTPDPARNELSMAVVSLLKGPVFRDRKPELWQIVTGALQARVRDHVAVLGVELFIDEAEGWAFLRSIGTNPSGDDTPPDDATSIPPLMARRPLTFEVSLLLALLRRRLAEQDGDGDNDGDRLILTTDDIVEMIRLFLPDSTNETKLLSRIDSHVNKCVDLGFLRRLDKRATAGRPVRYEVQRILTAFVDGQWLAEFDKRLAEYRTRLEAESSGEVRDEHDDQPDHDDEPDLTNVTPDQEVAPAGPVTPDHMVAPSHEGDAEQ